MDAVPTAASPPHLAVVGVFSAMPYRERRDAIRATWFRYAADTPVIITRFVVGTNASTHAALAPEAERHRDIVRVMTNVTTRDWGPYLLMWHWLSAAAKRWRKVPFIAKCDDDGYIVLPELASHLALVHARRLRNVYYSTFMWTSWHIDNFSHVLSATNALSAKNHWHTKAGQAHCGTKEYRDDGTSGSHVCDGPFPYGTAPLQLVGRDLALKIVNSEPAVASMRRSLALMADGRRNGTRKPGQAAFEDAWLGFAVHSLLPASAVNVTLVGLHRWYVFDTFSLKLNNYTMLIHDRLKHPLRTRWIHYYCTRWHCDSNATLSCRQVQAGTHLGNAGRHYTTYCEVVPGNSTCQSTLSTTDLRRTYETWDQRAFWPNFAIKKVGKLVIYYENETQSRRRRLR